MNTVLITGAAKRIGRGIVLRLHREGYRVAIHYQTSEKEARETAAECGDAPLFRANLESVTEIQRMFQEVEEQLGSLYGLVNNAARFRRKDPLEMTEGDWDFIHSVNLKGTFFCCQQGALLMKKTGAGRIVNIASLGGVLARALAPEISVNAVAPGVILSSGQEPNVQEMIAATPAGRSGTVEEVADAVVYFLNSTNFVTGQTLAVDGGLSQR
jgi:3-oxoacyl-[acyl-carrier protein] reductase